MRRDARVDDPDRLFTQLHNLKMVAAVAACGTITGAGQDLCRSPSVITRGVAEVEAVLRLELFERKIGHFGANWYARMLLARIRRIEEEITAAIAEFGRMRLPGSGPSAGLRHLLYSGRKLLLLLHLADARSASGAAGAMNLTQSGVSMALSRLENTLGLRLFYRDLQGMRPTDAGAKLILRARRMRAELRHALSELASAGGEPVGTVVIGALPLSRTDLLPRAISACLDQAPGVQVEVVEAPGDTLIARLRADEIDAVLTVPGSGFDPKGLIVEPLLTDELIVAAAADHPLARRRALSLHDLAQHRWILPGRHSVSRTAFEGQFTANGLPPPAPEVQTADLTLIRQLLLNKRDMLALTSRVLVEYEIRSGVIAQLDLAMTPIRREVVMLRRDGALHPPATTIMIEQIRSGAGRPLAL